MRRIIAPLLGFSVAFAGFVGEVPAYATVTARQSAAIAATYDQVRGDLAMLDVKGRAPKTGYSRDEFGPAWSDTDRNGCDTRNDILRRDLSSVVFKEGTNDCVVLSGVLQDPYTGTTINFTRGETTSTAVQIDHVVALSDAWQKGAQQVDVEARTQLANDPLNLLAVDGPANQAKSDGDAATWLPKNKAFRCEYVARQVEVKKTYDLWVTQAEHDAVATILENCTGEFSVTNTWDGTVQRFNDVPMDYKFYSEIEWMAQTGITTGYADGTFKPAGTVTRDAMAAFLYRVAGSPSFEVATTAPFKDVPQGRVFYADIAWMAQTGISTGYADRTYWPMSSVNRDAMAAFIYRLAGSPAFAPPSVPTFNDVSISHPFYKQIEWLASTGITTGWEDGGFHPGAPIARDAMAAFLQRTVSRSLVDPPAAVPWVEPEPPAPTVPPTTSVSGNSDGSCPAGYPIKGNNGSNGKIYHLPGDRWYNTTKAEECFNTAAAAQAAGYRPIK